MINKGSEHFDVDIGYNASDNLYTFNKKIDICIMEGKSYVTVPSLRLRKVEELDKLIKSLKETKEFLEKKGE